MEGLVCKLDSLAPGSWFVTGENDPAMIGFSAVIADKKLYFYADGKKISNRNAVVFPIKNVSIAPDILSYCAVGQPQIGDLLFFGSEQVLVVENNGYRNFVVNLETGIFRQIEDLDGYCGWFKKWTLMVAHEGRDPEAVYQKDADVAPQFIPL